MSIGTPARVLCLLALGLGPGLAAGEPDSFAAVVTEYEAIRSALARDQADGAASHAAKIRALTENGLTAGEAGVPESAAKELAGLLPQIAAAATKLAGAAGLEPVREAFGDLSAPVVHWFELRPDKGNWAVAYCPMVDKSWLQPRAPEVDNPYYGSEMLTCGRFVEPAAAR